MWKVEQFGRSGKLRVIVFCVTAIAVVFQLRFNCSQLEFARESKEISQSIASLQTQAYTAKLSIRLQSIEARVGLDGIVINYRYQIANHGDVPVFKLKAVSQVSPLPLYVPTFERSGFMIRPFQYIAPLDTITLKSRDSLSLEQSGFCNGGTMYLNLFATWIEPSGARGVCVYNYYLTHDPVDCDSLGWSGKNANLVQIGGSSGPEDANCVSIPPEYRYVSDSAVQKVVDSLWLDVEGANVSELRNP